MASLGMTNTYYHNIDAKGRINFPAKFREVLGESFWIARGMGDKHLTVYSQKQWEQISEEVEAVPGIQGEKLRRWLFSGAVEVTPDKQGRIILPQALRKFASLDKDVVVIGAGNKAEIWDQERWERVDDEYDPLSDEAVETLHL